MCTFCPRPWGRLIRTQNTVKTITATSTLVAGILLVLLLAIGLYLEPAAGGQEAGPSTEELRAGRNFIPTMVYSTEEDAQILKLFEGLRVADVSDGMDKVGLAKSHRLS